MMFMSAAKNTKDNEALTGKRMEREEQPFSRLKFYMVHCPDLPAKFYCE